MIIQSFRDKRIGTVDTLLTQTGEEEGFLKRGAFRRGAKKGSTRRLRVRR